MSLQLSAQNLVPNPSFESHETPYCNFVTHPYHFLSATNDWGMATRGTSDIFNTLVDVTCYANCLSNHEESPGMQLPHSGEFMAGIFTYGGCDGGEGGYREYLQVKLISPLVPGETYYGEFYVSQADSMRFASNELGMYFSETESTIYQQSDLCPKELFLPPSK